MGGKKKRKRERERGRLVPSVFGEDGVGIIRHGIEGRRNECGGRRKDN